MAENTSEQQVQEQPVQGEGEVSELQRVANATQLLTNQELSVPEEKPSLPQAETQTEEHPDMSKSEYYAKLVQKDKELRDAKTRLKDYESRGNIKEKIKNAPIETLKELGLTIDQVLEIWAGDGSDTNETSETTEETTNKNSSNQEVEDIKKELEQIKAQKHYEQVQQQVNQEYHKINSLVTGDEDNKWELVKVDRDGSLGIAPGGSLKLVLDTAIEMYKINEETPSYEDVLNLVEDHYQKQLTGQLEKAKSLTKLKTLFNIQEERKVEEQNKVGIRDLPVQSPPAHSTLSNELTDDTLTQRDYTEEERFKRALAVLEQKGD